MTPLAISISLPLKLAGAWIVVEDTPAPTRLRLWLIVSCSV